MRGRERRMLTRDKDDSAVLVAVLFPERGACLAGGEHAPKVGVKLLQEIIVRHFERRLGYALVGNDSRLSSSTPAWYCCPGPRPTHHSSIRDKSSDGSKVRIHRVHKLVHRLGIRRVDLVRLGLDIELLGNLLGDFRRFLAAVVDDGDVTARLSYLSGNRQADTSITAGDDDRLGRWA